MMNIGRSKVVTLIIAFFIVQEICAKEIALSPVESWDVNLTMSNANLQQAKKIKQAIQLIKQVIKTEEFKEQILNYRFNGQKKFHHNLNFSNEAIYQMILQGAEMIGTTEQNNKMDLDLEFYYQATSTIGYTYPNTTKIWVNTKYFDHFDPVKVADNLMHEWMHKLGFDHEAQWSENREHSVPYAVGYILEGIGHKIFLR